MSHFTVLVVGDDVEGQMAKYDENKDMEPYWRLEAETAGAFWNTDTWVKAGKLPAEPTMEQVLALILAEYKEDSEDYKIEDGKLYARTTYNPDSKWDWYEIGGRWRGFFTLKPNVTVGVVADRQLGGEDPTVALIGAHDGSQMAVLGRPGTGEWMEIRDGKDLSKNYSGTADQARKGDIDFEMMKVMVGAEAQATFDAFAQATAGIKSPGPRSEYFKKALGDLFEVPVNGLTEEEGKERQRLMSEAHASWAKEPFQQAMRAADVALFMEDEHTFYCLDAPNPREAFIEAAVDAAFSTFAVVKDGEWYGKGDMGWFGITSNEENQGSWNAKVRKMIEGLPDDTLLTMLDCHI